MRKYNKLRTTKRLLCAGKKTKADLKKAAKDYVDAAVKKGQTRTEANRKAKAVTTAGCTMSSNVAGTRKKKKSTRSRRK